MRHLQRRSVTAIWNNLRMNSATVAVKARSTSPPHKKPRLSTELGEPLDSPLALASSSIEARSVPKQTKKGKKNKRAPPLQPCSPEDVNFRDVCRILGSEAVERAASSGTEYAAPIALHTEIELEIADITPHGK